MDRNFRVVQGAGIYHTPKVQYSPETHKFLKGNTEHAIYFSRYRCVAQREVSVSETNNLATIKTPFQSSWKRAKWPWCSGRRLITRCAAAIPCRLWAPNRRSWATTSTSLSRTACRNGARSARSKIRGRTSGKSSSRCIRKSTGTSRRNIFRTWWLSGRTCRTCRRLRSGENRKTASKIALKNVSRFGDDLAWEKNSQVTPTTYPPLLPSPPITIFFPHPSIVYAKGIDFSHAATCWFPLLMFWA